MPEDQRKAYIQALERCNELEADIMQLAQDLKMSMGEVQLVCSRILFKLCNEGLFVDYHDENGKT